VSARPDTGTVREAAQAWALAQDQPFWSGRPMLELADELGVAAYGMEGEIIRALDAMSGDGKPLVREVRFTGVGLSRAIRYAPAAWQQQADADAERKELARAERRQMAAEVAGMISGRIGEALRNGEGEATPVAVDSRDNGDGTATIDLENGLRILVTVTVGYPVDE
jgi:hypothetical protein